LFKCDDDDATEFVDTMLMTKNDSRAYRISCILYFLAMQVNKRGILNNVVFMQMDGGLIADESCVLLESVYLLCLVMLCLQFVILGLKLTNDEWKNSS